MGKMANAADNQGRIAASQQRPPDRREQVLKEIALALVTTHGAGGDARQRGGFDPYDARLGSNQRDVWGRKRRA
jgi:hypothetical protein